MRLAEGPEPGLNLRDEFLDERIAERTVVGRVDVVRVAVGAGAVELKEDCLLYTSRCV